MRDEGERVDCRYCHKEIRRIEDDSGRYVYCDIEPARFVNVGKIYRGYPLHKCEERHADDNRG